MRIDKLCVSKLNIGLKKNKIISDLSYSFESGKLTVLTGPNGVGKSTLFKSLVGLNQNNEFMVMGNIHAMYDDKTCIDYLTNQKLKQKAQLISYLSQNEINIWDTKVSDYVLQGRFCYTDNFGNYNEKDYDEVKKVLEQLGLIELIDRKIFSLSGGEFQKIRIARTLAQESKILVLDEPGENLDYGYLHNLFSCMKTITKEKKLITIISIHDINCASIFADNILLLGKCKKNNDTFFQDYFFGTSNEVISKDNLFKIYQTEFELFEHPKYHVPQVYL